MFGHTFFLHEYDWGELELLPVENRVRCLGVLSDLQAFDKAQAGGRHTEVFVLPDTQQDCRILEREIPLFALQRLLEPTLRQAGIVQSGSSAALRVVNEGYAFGEAYGEQGAVYGIQPNGTLHSLNVLLPHSTGDEHLSFFTKVLTTLAVTYDLFLLDWWHKRVVTIRDTGVVRLYLQTSAEELEHAADA